MKRYCLIALFLFFYVWQAFATHQRAGEITYKQISGLTYEITIVTYSYSPSQADRNSLIINYGDGDSAELQRINGPSGINPAGYYCEHLGEMVGFEIKKNIYTGTHTYPSFGTYILWLEDPNRNEGIINVPNSVNVPLYIESLLVINPFLGANTSPELLMPPIDNGCVGVPFLHNPGAYDREGDSLSYKLVICRGAMGQNIPGYTYPEASESFALDSVTGDLLWKNPVMAGEYNVAFLIEEWRAGQRIGYVTRDMQINISACNNNPPVIQSMADTCIETGKTLRVRIVATDADNDKITLTGTGGPLELTENPATFEQPVDSIGRVSSVFRWTPDCDQVRNSSYTMYFKAKDNGSPINLVDIKSFNIKVVASAPEGLTAVPLGNTIKLSWNRPSCTKATGYIIYRKNQYYGYTHGNCVTGVPEYTGYTRIVTLKSLDETSFTDDNNGTGLVQGRDYCYMVTILFPDSAESYPTPEVCSALKKDIPVITNVSITNPDPLAGSVYVAWSKPTEIDTVQAPGPYKYVLLRSQGFYGTDLVPVDSTYDLNDTIALESNLNTADNSLSYRIDFYNNNPSNYFKIGSSQVASSVFLAATPSDRSVILTYNFNVPWTNSSYVIYRLNSKNRGYDSIATTNMASYQDTGLINGNTYCYQVKSIGRYATPGMIDPIENFSQYACAVPNDNVVPCAPVLDVSTNCEEVTNTLTWTFLGMDCASDAVKYYIYYSPLSAEDLQLTDSVEGMRDTVYVHLKTSTYIGCYAVKVRDSIGNLSEYSNIVCVDSDACSSFDLPNVFAPEEATNNRFKALSSITNVNKIQLTVFDRWGKIMYETSDPRFQWDGKNKNTHRDCSAGVYFYVCDVYIQTLKGLIKSNLKGSVTILR